MQTIKIMLTEHLIHLKLIKIKECLGLVHTTESEAESESEAQGVLRSSVNQNAES